MATKLRDVQRWIDRYVEAWRSYEPTTIGDLFTDDAEYRWDPFGVPVRGRAAIVQAWTGDRDAPGSWEAEYGAIAVTGNVGVVRGRTRYFSEDRRSVDREYANIFVIEFAEDGRCERFTEWYFQRPE